MLIAASVMNRVFGVGRHVHDEDVTDAPRSSKSGRAKRSPPHQLIGMQAALHQQLAFGFVDQLDGFCRCRVAMRRRRRFRIGRYRDHALARPLRSCSRGPTRTGMMMPPPPPRSRRAAKLSSQDARRASGGGRTALARAIRRSYLDLAGVRGGSDARYQRRSFVSTRFDPPDDWDSTGWLDFAEPSPAAFCRRSEAADVRISVDPKSLRSRCSRSALRPSISPLALSTWESAATALAPRLASAAA